MMYNQETMVIGRSKHILLLILIACLIIPATFFLFPQKTKAQATCAGSVISYLGINAAANLVLGVPTTNTKSEAFGFSDFFDQCILQPLAIDMAQRILANITSSLVNWIQSGFNGSPAFVTNMNDLVSNSADQAIGEFIQSPTSGLSLLCQPFALKIRIALAIGFSTQQYQGCTLTQVTDNIESFGNSFNTWNQWLDVTTVPENNQYGAYVQASGILSDKINAALNNVNSEVNRNGGFLDYQQCDQWEDSAAVSLRLADEGDIGGDETDAQLAEDEKPQCTHSHTTTPGTAISNALSGSYSAEFNKIGLANDIDEVISALVNELVSETITGAGGLLGGSTPPPVKSTDSLADLAGSESTSNQDTINDLTNQVNASSSQALSGLSSSGTQTSGTSGGSSVSFSNAYPTTDPISVSTTSAFPTYSVNVSLPQASTNLQAVITLDTGSSLKYDLTKVFDKSIYALYVGNSGGGVTNDDPSGILLQSGSLTFPVSSSVTALTFNLRSATVIAFRNTSQTFNLTIKIEDGSGNILGTQTAQIKTLVN